MFPRVTSTKIMKTPPESFLIFKEELKKARLEKERLQREYESKLANMNNELERLKEQIAAQQELMKTTLEYAIRLEENLDSFKVEVANAPTLKKKSFH
jgi:hypothetical protein